MPRPPANPPEKLPCRRWICATHPFELAVSHHPGFADEPRAAPYDLAEEAAP